jgi:hypothetical protein
MQRWQHSRKNRRHRREKREVNYLRKTWIFQEILHNNYLQRFYNLWVDK